MNYNQKIPKIIHRTIPNQTTDLMDKCWNSVLLYTQGWKHMTHYDEDKYDICGPYLNLCEKGAFRADLIRLEALYNYGGIYLDSDIELCSSLDLLLDNDFFAPIENDFYMSNLVMGATPKHPLVLEMLNMSIFWLKAGLLVSPYQILDPKAPGTWVAFGPYIVHNICFGKEGVTTLDSKSFDLYYDKSNRMGTYGKHHYAGSWTV